MGNGQYYDPHTGRFLTRGVNSQQTNPYVPWAADPSGMLFAPLALFSMVYGRRKKQAAKWEILLLVLLMGGSLMLGITTASAHTSETSAVQAPSIPVASYTSVQVGGTVSSSFPSVSGTPNNEPITTCIISLSPLPESYASSTYVLIFYGLDVCNCETLVPYLDWARDKGYNIKTFRVDTVNNTKDMTRKHVNEYIYPLLVPELFHEEDGNGWYDFNIQRNYDNEYIFIGHSAGADAAVLAANDLINRIHISGIVLLDPTLTATVNSKIIDLSKMASSLALRTKVFLADTPNDGYKIGEPDGYRYYVNFTGAIFGDRAVEGYVDPENYTPDHKVYPYISHCGVSNDEDVYKDVLTAMGWN